MLESTVLVTFKFCSTKLPAFLLSFSRHCVDARPIPLFNLQNLEELTIHDGSKEQFQSITELKNLKRLRVTHLRPKQIDERKSKINIRGNEKSIKVVTRLLNHLNLRASGRVNIYGEV